MNIEKGKLWNLFFVCTGFGSLLYWNSCLNLVSYFILNVRGDIFTHYSFAVSFGGLLAFIVGPHFFRKFSNRSSILFSFIFSGILFFITLYLVQLNFAIGSKSFITTLIIFFCGFFITIVQGKGAGIASSIGSAEIRLFNFGGGLCGATVSLVNIFLNIFDPVDPLSPVDE